MSKHNNFWNLTILVLALMIFCSAVIGYSSSALFTSERLVQVLEKEIGSSTNFDGIKRFPLVLVADEISGDLFQSLKEIANSSGHSLYEKTHLAVVYMVGDDNLTRGFVKRGILQNIARVDYYAFLNFDSLHHLFVYPRFPMQDDYGDTKMSVVGIQYLHRNTATKFNWSTVITSLPDKIKEGSDYFRWAPGF